MDYRIYHKVLNKLKTNQRTWLCFSASVLFLTLCPAIGALGLIIIMVVVWQHNYHAIMASYLCKTLGLLAGLLIISSALAEYPQSAWLGLANFLPYFALFIAFRCLITELSQLRQLAWLLILPSVPIVILGLGQLFFAWDTPLWVETILGWELVPSGVPAGRMSAVFIYANFLAIYLAIAFTLTVGLWWTTWQQSSKLKIPILWLLTLILVLDVSCLLYTSPSPRD